MKYFLFLGVFLFPFLTHAELDEFTISTEDKSCSIRYLTSKTKYNWTIKVNASKCKDGWVDGRAEVQIYSPTKQQTETLSGFFTQGYWLDTFPPVHNIVERTSPAPKTQSLSFILDEDKEANITYIGQLRATQPQDRSYSAFQGCPSFRVLVVVPDTSVFQNPAFQDKIVKQGLKYAHSYCPHPDILALFGATSIKSPKIVFHMQVDCLTGERKIILVKENNEKTSMEPPSELREEKADILLAVEPTDNKAVVSYNPKEHPFPFHQKESQNKPISFLHHLRILSKINLKPEFGRIVVHIDKILLDGSGVTVLPDEISLLYYPNLKTGWAIVDGWLDDNKMKISDVQFCEKEWCNDVS